MRLEDKVIIVTGASRGIGQEIALLLAENGARVIVNHSNSTKDADATVAKIKDHGGTAIALKADVSDRDQVTQLFDQTIAAFGKVDVLVNNAGVLVTKKLKDNTQEDFNRLFDVNVKGVFNTLQEADSKLSDNGNIINISSSTAKLMFPSFTLYTPPQKLQ
ncbi:SDR family NAD(P)-dependent oxidoreductase [Maribacter ulvicola]|uniref:3-oxoacyl-[acyl-carrier protein] reductase n=1 Tax=Maribacter ulvicola TaxID=228959 RepID=A0A1N6ZRN9_9FLAO|nr:SDR family NAD(P)-dependent oxidoreductase [Maribacter ulvicola]SIR29562.1 3-oxoacyl-[acyl-carrier protein] reductase [Maribacter ulvicola]